MLCPDERGKGRMEKKKSFIPRNRKLTVLLSTAVIIALISAGDVLWSSKDITAATQLSVLIICSNATNTSGANMQTALGSTDYTVTVTYTVPSVATANTYDVVIYTQGTSSGATSAANAQFLDDYLNTGKGHLIIEGEPVINDLALNAPARLQSILKVSSTYTQGKYTSLTVSDSTHPVTQGLAATVTTTFANSVQDAITPVGTAGVVITGNLGNTVNVWDSSNGRRLVYMPFPWYVSTSNYIADAAWRNTLLRNAVNWVGENLNVSGTSLAPASADQGAAGVVVEKLTFQANKYATMILNYLKLTRTGTSTNDADVAAVKLYADANRNGVVDAGETLLGTRNFVAGVAEFNGLNFTVNDTGQDLLVVLDLATVAQGGKTVGVQLTDTASAGVGTGDNPLISGTFPIASGTLSINDITPPSKPRMLAVSNPGTGTGLNLSWQANGEVDVAGYHVFRSTSLNGTYTQITGSPVTGTTYPDLGLTQFSTYYYKIKAVDTSNNDSVYSDPASGVPNAPPTTPTGLTLTNSGTGGKLQAAWTAVSDSDLAGYNLYRSTSAGGSYTKVNSTVIAKPATTFNDTGLTDGVPCYYKVVAIDQYNLESPLSAAVSGTPTDTTPPNVTSIYPTANQTAVPRQSIIKITFDDSLATATLTAANLKLNDGSIDLPGTISYDQNKKTVSFAPNQKLAAAGTFTFTVTIGVKNAAGLNLSAPFSWQFSTLVSPHGNFTANTDLCAACHKTHSAVGAQLLKAPTGTELCYMCHDGSQSSYNVLAGTFWNGETMVPSLAGGFAPDMGYTSTHIIDQSAVIPGGAAAPFSLTCLSCHNPHGSGNYRLLQTTVNGISNLSVSGTVYGPGQTLKTASGNEVATYVYGVSAFCSACHLDYVTYNGPNTNGGQINYRHRMGVPLIGGSTGGDRVISYPEPGLLTTLPTEGTPTGANIINQAVFSGGSLSVNTYNYTVTAVNAAGESKYGNIYQVTTGAANSAIRISWEPVTNAVNYRVYRYVGAGDPKLMDINNFAFLIELGDNSASFDDAGQYTPDITRKPPATSNAKLMCLTCHYAHGTKATDTQNSIRLKRLNNFGVCEDCHKK